MRGRASRLCVIRYSKQAKGGEAVLFRKNIEPKCAYCARAARVDDFTVACEKKGIVDAEGQCRRFKYDPLKRTPLKKPQLVTRGLTDDDFKLE